MQWNPEQYTQFRRERMAPFSDASALITRRSGMDVIDLGCGTGELTALLADMLPDSRVLGIDSSAAMLEQAHAFARANLEFAQADISAISGSWDLVFSHAAIQWLDQHTELLPKLWELVRPGGQFVVQIPSNHGHVSHRLLGELASREPFASALDGWQRQWPVLPLDAYAQILWELGGTELVVREHVYPHVLVSADAVVEWTKGTALLPYLQRLPAELADAFVTDYRSALRAALPQAPVFYGFRRIMWSAHKPA